MKPFVFRAQAALELRRREEEAALRDLADAERHERGAAASLAVVREALEQAIAHGCDEDGRPGDLTLKLWHRKWIVGRHRVVDLATKALNERRQEREAAAGRALVAQRRRKALERLRERAEAAWQRAEAREAQIAIDELAGVRYVRSRMGGLP
jgi:flagellar export protein FliJ